MIHLLENWMLLRWQYMRSDETAAGTTNHRQLQEPSRPDRMDQTGSSRDSHPLVPGGQGLAENQHFFSSLLS